MIRLIANGLVLVFLLTVTLVAGLYWGLATESGALWLVRQARLLAPGLSVARVEGVVMGRLVVQGLDYRGPLERLHVDRIELWLEPRSLWEGELRIRRLDLQGPQFFTRDDSPLRWPDLHWPFALAIDAIRITDAILQWPGATEPTRVDRLDAALSLTRQGLDIQRLAWVMPGLNGEIAGHLGLAKVDLKTVWTWHPAGRPAFHGEGSAEGSLDRVVIRQSLTAPLVAELSMVLLQPLTRLEWTAQLDAPEFPANQALPGWPDWPVALSLAGEGAGEEARIAGNLESQVPGAGTLRANLQSRLRMPGELVVESFAISLPGTQAGFRLNGAASHLDQTPEFKFNANWDNLTWPLNQPPVWRSQRGEASVTGSVQDLRFALEARLADQPVTAGGRLGFLPERMEFHEIRAQGAGLDLRLDGVLGPRLDLNWALKAEQLGLWLPGARGRISSRGQFQGPRDSPAGTAELSVRDLAYRGDAAREVDLQTKGGLAPGGPPLEAALKVQGLRYADYEAREARLGFRGGLALSQGRLQLISPSAELSLSGDGLRYQDHELQAVSLRARGGLLPGSPPVEGQVQARVLRLGEAEGQELTLDFRGGLVQRGDGVVPHGAPLELRLLAARLSRGQFEARDVRLELKGGGQPDSPVSLRLEVPDGRYAGGRLNLTLDGHGTLARHGLTGRVEGRLPGQGGVGPRPASLNFSAEGGWSAAAWSGRLGQFDLAVESLGVWRLTQAAPLRVGRSAGELGLACWVNRGAEVCARASFGESGGWKAAVRIDEFPLDHLRAWMPASVVVQGALNAEWRLSGQGDRLSDGQFEASVTSALIAKAGAASPLKFRPAPLALHGLVTPRGAELRLTAEQIGFASLHVELDLDGPLVLSRLGQMPMDGEAFLELRNIGVLAPMVEDIDQLHGRLTAGVRFAGTPDLPRLRVHATLFDAGFGVPRLGIKVRSLNADAVSHDHDQLAITGRAVSGSGELKLEGTATLSPRDGWPLSLSLRGKRFLAADIPEAKVWLSPDLRIEHRDARLSLTGTLTIPEAAIRIPDESDAIKPSSDVVIVTGDEPPEARANPLETRVAVVLGDRINVTGPGYQARVDGQVTIEQSPGQDAVGTGEIKIHDGQYSLYGVDLEVDGGRLVFAHSPMDNPSLDIRAVRKSDDLQAGAKLLGTLNKPSISLFADQPMSQTDILAYLVMGKPFDPLAQQDSSAMKGAASALGGSAGGLLAKELASRLGIGSFVDISMQSSLGAGGVAQSYGGSGPWGSTQGTALFLGKYLTPKIYVQYGMGLFQNAYVFRLRYDLTRRWKMQTETGEYSGGDILYQWEE